MPPRECGRGLLCTAGAPPPHPGHNGGNDRLKPPEIPPRGAFACVGGVRRVRGGSGWKGRAATSSDPRGRITGARDATGTKTRLGSTAVRADVRAGALRPRDPETHPLPPWSGGPRCLSVLGGPGTFAPVPLAAHRWPRLLNPLNPSGSPRPALSVLAR